MLGSDTTHRIVGGQNAQREEFPWQAALVKTGTRQPFCGKSAGKLFSKSLIFKN